MSIENCIYQDFIRPPRDLVEGFRGIPAANIDDCMGRIGAVRAEILPFGRHELLGVAFTVKVAEGDNLMFHKAMDLAKPGDVIVIDAGGCMKRSIFGGLMAHYCKLRGIAGILVDGCIRDADEIAAMDFPVYARGVIPNGPYKNGPGAINVPISFGGKTICPGDIVAGDGDGIVTIDPADAPAILEAARAVVEKEQHIMEEQLQSGSYDRPWVDSLLQEKGCKIMDLWPGRA